MSADAYAASRLLAVANAGAPFDARPSHTEITHGQDQAARVARSAKHALVELVDLLQWPAMALTLAASWWVASSSSKRRNLGFWLFLVSNILWAAWGLYAHAYALVVLQAGLVAMNVRGMRKTDEQASQQSAA